MRRQGALRKGIGIYLNLFFGIVISMALIHLQQGFAFAESSSDFELKRMELINSNLYMEWQKPGDGKRYDVYLNSAHANSYYSGGTVVEGAYDIDENESMSITVYLYDIKKRSRTLCREYVCLNHHHNYEVKNVIKATNKQVGKITYGCTDKACHSMKSETVKALSELDLKVNNGIKNCTLSWKRDAAADFYEIWKKGTGETKYRKIGKTRNVSYTVKPPLKTELYKIRSCKYMSCASQPISNFSQSVCLKKTDIKVSTVKSTINGYVYTKKTHEKVALKWARIADADMYKIYQKTKGGKYKAVKTVKDNKQNSAVIKELKPLTEYWFKIKAFDGKTCIESKAVKVKTWSVRSGYFYNQVVWNKTWSGVLITNKMASTKQMNALKINGVKPAIKYNYSRTDKTLYIHVYGKFLGSEMNQKFTYYKWTGKQYRKSKSAKVTYKNAVLSGIKKYWNIEVKGDKYDFAKGCNFNTKVIFHTKSLEKGQKYIQFNIGGKKCYYSLYGSYWFRAKSVCSKNEINELEYCYDKNPVIYLPTNVQLAKNRNHNYRPKRNLAEYKDAVAHEFGHVLGLADAYKTDIQRITKNNEIGYYEKSVFKNIMYSTPDTYAVANDIEMALQAQGDAIKEKSSSYQAYRTYDDGAKYKKSKVIRKR